MDLKELKTAWNKYSSQQVDKHRLGEKGIYELLQKRTQTLVDRIDRNIRIGMGLLGLFIVYLVVDYFFLTDFFTKLIVYKTIDYPKWLQPIDAFSTVLIITTYLFFVIRYFKTKRSFSIHLHLKELLLGIQETLSTYRRMFYLAVIILLINVLISYIAGINQGLQLKADVSVNGIINLSMQKILIIIGISLLILLPLFSLSFFILRWGFNKLYGQYLNKIDDMLQELDEPTETAQLDFH